jgi:hypothetical protein
MTTATAPRPAAIEVIAIRHLDGQTAVKAFLDLQLGGITLKGCKIVQQENARPWLAMPATKSDRGRNNVVELTKELRKRATEIALEAWQHSLRQQQPSLPPDPTTGRDRVAEFDRRGPDEEPGF